MALSQAQKTIYEKATRLGAGDQGISLSDAAVRALVLTCASDLDVEEVNSAEPIPDFFTSLPSDVVVSEGESPGILFSRLIDSGPLDSDSYFSSISALHRARLKYQNILRLQPIPTLEQVGPRGLLQYGLSTPAALGALLLIRKWMFDVDNRAAQETGYLFEPIIAGAIGGAPASARNSPVKRNGDGSGRQVDCVVGKRAYEIKLRVTIAASGQGRWGEELSFPEDCRRSGLVPVLNVFDATPNPKLADLSEAFEAAGGEVYAGDDAWNHLTTEAGPTMAVFIERYVRTPLAKVLEMTPDVLPTLELALSNDAVTFRIGEETISLPRQGSGELGPNTQIPNDVNSVLPGL